MQEVQLFLGAQHIGRWLLWNIELTTEMTEEVSSWPTDELIVDCLHLSLQCISLAQRRHEELRKAVQGTGQCFGIDLKMVIGVLLHLPIAGRLVSCSLVQVDVCPGGAQGLTG